MIIDFDEHSQFDEDAEPFLDISELLQNQKSLDARRRVEHRSDLLRLREQLYDPLFDIDLSNY